MNYIPRVARSIQLIGTNLNISRHLNTHKLSNVLPIFVQYPCTDYSWIWQKNNNLKLPVVHSVKIELPNSIKVPLLIDQPVNGKLIEAPSTVNSDISKQAARLIIIRRKKMKKHKLKKLRKRMKFEWAKAVLIQQCKEAEAFSAEQYVQEKISKLNEIATPSYSKWKRWPEFLLREKMGLPPKK
ncbi:hypothetical protein NQ314_008714 [Rhamnusium bicolor]|uniref:Small ribosomal subunit protein mS38 n=1 Tax=Rhamnusium bicolor TaxID=1586634 RepID=A0AAV8Y7N4_9CUCU|nr:hypothetical protein NQ314_008714 [Rhamnusium bicolor]